jgi:hypothetical protein
MLNTLRSEPFFAPPATHYFNPEDLATMRHAYHVACQERPMAAWTEAQRLILAKAIVVVYNPILSEAALLGAAFDLMA